MQFSGFQPLKSKGVPLGPISHGINQLLLSNSSFFYNVYILSSLPWSLLLPINFSNTKTKIQLLLIFDLFWYRNVFLSMLNQKKKTKDI